MTTATRARRTRFTSLRWPLAALVTAVVAAGCSSEIKGIEDDEGSASETASTSAAPTTSPQAPPTNIDEPAPISFAVGDCMEVDFSGVGPRFAAVVTCDQAHHAEVYHALVVEEEQTAANITDACAGELSSKYRDPAAGTFYAVESPLNFVYNQGLTDVGDEVLCVYVHAQERSSAM
ncbi:MAG: hypothetical protein WDZ57_04740 [Demequina sp.]